MTVHVGLDQGGETRVVVGPNAAEASLPQGALVTLEAAARDVLVFLADPAP